MKIANFFIIITLFGSCSNRDTTFIETEKHIPVKEVSELVEQLELCYKNNDSIALDNFFKEWNRNSRPNKNVFINQNDTIKALYEVFKTFYKPTNPTELGNWEDFHLTEDCLKYVIIQNRIEYFVNYIENRYELTGEYNIPDTIKNFKPITTFNSNRILYLTEDYRSALEQFLGNNSSEVGEGNLMNPSIPQEESNKRYKFLKKFIHILPGHWGGYWHLETHPEIYGIVLNPELDEANIMFRYGYQGGKAKLIKTDEKWEFKYSKETWIE